MPLHNPTQPAATDRDLGRGMEDRWRLADLEVAQRRNLYAAGRGDRRERPTRRRWNIRRPKHS